MDRVTVASEEQFALAAEHVSKEDIHYEGVVPLQLIHVGSRVRTEGASPKPGGLRVKEVHMFMNQADTSVDRVKELTETMRGMQIDNLVLDVGNFVKLPYDTADQIRVLLGVLGKISRNVEVCVGTVYGRGVMMEYGSIGPALLEKAIMDIFNQVPGEKVLTFERGISIESWGPYLDIAIARNVTVDHRVIRFLVPKDAAQMPASAIVDGPYSESVEAIRAAAVRRQDFPVNPLLWRGRFPRRHAPFESYIAFYNDVDTDRFWVQNNFTPAEAEQFFATNWFRTPGAGRTISLSTKWSPILNWAAEQGMFKHVLLEVDEVDIRNDQARMARIAEIAERIGQIRAEHLEVYMNDHEVVSSVLPVVLASEAERLTIHMHSTNVAVPTEGVAQAIARNTHVRHLKVLLPRHESSNVDTASIVKGLRLNASVEKLYIGGHPDGGSDDLTAPVVMALKELLLSENKTLTALRVKFGMHMLSISYLLPALAENKSVRSVIFMEGRPNLGERGTANRWTGSTAFDGVLAKNTTLRKLVVMTAAIDHPVVLSETTMRLLAKSGLSDFGIFFNLEGTKSLISNAWEVDGGVGMRQVVWRLFWNTDPWKADANEGWLYVMRELGGDAFRGVIAQYAAMYGVELTLGESEETHRRMEDYFDPSPPEEGEAPEADVPGDEDVPEPNAKRRRTRRRAAPRVMDFHGTFWRGTLQQRTGASYTGVDVRLPFFGGFSVDHVRYRRQDAAEGV